MQAIDWRLRCDDRESVVRSVLRKDLSNVGFKLSSLIPSSTATPSSTEDVIRDRSNC
jgi:hypothetical protein